MSKAGGCLFRLMVSAYERRMMFMSSPFIVGIIIDIYHQGIELVV